MVSNFNILYENKGCHISTSERYSGSCEETFLEGLKMKVLLTLAAVVGVSGYAFADANNPVLVTAPVEKVYVPAGFDDNDKVEVIVHGHFNSSCYKMGPVSATVDEQTKRVTVSAQAFYYAGEACVQMITPFIKSVELDRHLSAGTYKITVADRPDATASGLKVVKSMRPDADDFLYASVNNATMETTADGTRELVLKGQHPYLLDGCVKIDDIKTKLGEDKTLVVQPITSIVYGDECKGAVNNRFEVRKSLNGQLTQGEYLMHVRVLDGNAINQLVNLD
jgi:hypothetical protein